MSDLFHVLDYAVLMGQLVIFEYRGSPLVRKGTYTVSPLNVEKSPEPFLDAQVMPKKAKKKSPEVHRQENGWNPHDQAIQIRPSSQPHGILLSRRRHPHQGPCKTREGIRDAALAITDHGGCSART